MTGNIATISVDLLAAAHRSETIPRDWRDEDIVRARDRYLKFLVLAAKYPCQELAPTRDIDVMWHLHMLHPRAYAHDTMSMFGEILDHDGGFGSSPDDVPLLEQAILMTARLWQAEFGEEYFLGDGGPATKCKRNCKSRCWHACKQRALA